MKGWVRRFVTGPLTRAAIHNGHHVVRLLGTTWRVRHFQGDAVKACRDGGRGVLYVFSHGVLLPLAYTHRRRSIQVLISESRDGEIIARITGTLGFGEVRGSSSRGGGRAVIELVRRAETGADLAITPDGPRGPRGSVSPGAVVVSRRGSIPLIPVGVAASRCWRLKSWDRFLIPKPGARVAVCYGRPILISPEEAGDDLAPACRELEKTIAQIERRAEECMGSVEWSAGRKGDPA